MENVQIDYYQIAEIAGEKAHAGTKATRDVVHIAENLNFKALYVRMNDTKLGIIHKINRQIRFYKDWAAAYRDISDEAIVLLQHPFHYPQLSREKTLLQLKKKKRVSFISVVHDVEELRTLGKEEYYKREFEFMMGITDVLIVHNDIMRDFFVEKGFDSNNIVVLKIFDYLRSEGVNQIPLFDKSITIAGNLDVKKSGYLSGLSKISCLFNLYGPNYSLDNADNVTYGGILPPDEISTVLTKGFGLIWDGDSMDTCKGGFGDYLRYNNPHKLSLYLSSGLPVFIWEEAAEAKFVQENDVGYTIASLSDIPKVMSEISEIEYRRVSENVMNLSKGLIKGKYMQLALEHAIAIIKEKKK